VLAVTDARLFVADAAHKRVVRIALPLGADSPFEARPMEGRPAAVVRTKNALLVTQRNPSALLVLDPDDLSESARIALPKGAGPIAVLSDGKALVVSREEAKLSLVDVAAGAVSWSAPLPARPQGLWVRGGEAIVTHALSAGTTTVEGGAWSEPPEVTATNGPPALFDGRVAGTNNGVVTAHGSRREGSVRPVISISGQSRPLPALPAHSFVRTLVAHASSEALLAVTDDAVVELSMAGKERGRAAQPCRDARGAAVARDDGAVYVACVDGDVVRLALPLDDAQPIVRFRAAAAAPDECAGVDTTGRISEAFDAAQYQTAAQVQEVLRRYHCRYPARTSLFPIATSHEGRKVWAMAIGREPEAHRRPTIFLNGGHHGDELMATTFALDAIAALLEDDVGAGELEEVVFVVAPLVNPDGNAHRFASGLGRKNGRDNDGDGERGPEEGVDINRNYPFRWGALGEDGSRSDPAHKWYRGPSAASEPETKGVIRLANSEKFAASMSFHTGALTLCASYTIPRVKNPDPDAAFLVGWDIVTNIPPHPEGGVPVQRRLYPLDGNDQDWLRHEHGTLAYLWEGGEDWVSHPPRKFRASARGAWLALARRFVRGPTVSVRASDVTGRPLVAEVSVAEIELFEDERWTTRCRDGRFDYILPRPGDYTVVVQRGDARVERAVHVGKGEHPTLDVVFPVLIEEPAACPTPTRDGGRPAKVVVVR
jgi:hypothetical protein